MTTVETCVSELRPGDLVEDNLDNTVLVQSVVACPAGGVEVLFLRPSSDTVDRPIWLCEGFTVRKVVSTK